MEVMNVDSFTNQSLRLVHYGGSKRELNASSHDEHCMDGKATDIQLTHCGVLGLEEEERNIYLMETLAVVLPTCLV